MDISSAMLKEAVRKAPSLEHKLLRADLRRLPFANDVFAGALIVHILHLIGDWKLVLQEVRRVLRPGASLFIGSETGRSFPTVLKYLDLAREHGQRRDHIGAGSQEMVFDFLFKQGCHVERIDEGAFRWIASATTSELLASLKMNPYSQLWHLTREEHSSLFTELLSALGNQCADQNETEQAKSEMVLWQVRFPER